MWDNLVELALAMVLPIFSAKEEASVVGSMALVYPFNSIYKLTI